MNKTSTIYSGLEIAVIGMSGRFPGAKNIDEFWNNLKNGTESISFFSEEELIKSGLSPELVERKDYVKAASIIDDFEYFDAIFFGYTPKEAEIMNPQTRILYECVYEALEDAGYASESYTGSIGFYAGAANNNWDALAILSGKSNEIGRMAADSLSNKDNLATRISYKLNLRGPSIFIRTACSTSLVAIHLACRALLTKECDIALSGGISIRNLQKIGYLYQEGLTASADGHCRPFDARANGTIFGDGAGVVVLKKLQNAIDDGDNIYAIIKGSAINNDGYSKVAYTAPSVNGQAEVIKSAMKVAGVNPKTIGLVETHGTATKLGDTVEIEALKIAFGPSKEKSCALGSIKSGIEHLEAASGVIAVIKTVLALKFKLIPPTLHFESPNPEIDFDNSPFYVNTKLSGWKNANPPLRAGVSSFGFGGTNGHVVLEEAPIINRKDSTKHPRPYQLLVLSAKTQSALEKTTENLVEYFKHNPDTNLTDAAYTLGVGRKTFQYKRILVCPDIDEAISELSARDSINTKVRTFNSKRENPLVVFVFAGLGSQYVNMGLDLYQNEPLFRDELNRCFDILKPLMNNDVKEILYPGDRSMSSISASQANPRPDINQPEFSQPIIFIFEYALAVLLMKWGINPRAMIGYSLGEYVAACIAGVFSLEDALKLVVSRGQSIQKIPSGVMLSVPLPIEEVTSLLNSELSLAIDNGPSCIVAGSTAAISAFEKQLKDRKVLSVQVPASHAIHSEMMEPISKEFENLIAQFTLNKPKISFISNVTGTWIEDEEVVTPAYWVKHLNQTVQFALGMKELAKEDKAIFLEIGPGQDLSSLILRYIDKEADQRIFNFIRPPHKNISDVNFMINKIGRLWLYGVKVDWNRFYGDEKRFRIPLPTYPFERKFHWIKGDLFNLDKGFVSPRTITKKKKIDEWFYIPSWRRSTFTNVKEISPGQSNWLVFMDDRGVGDELIKCLEKSNQGIIQVEPGPAFDKKSENLFIINPTEKDNYIKLVEWLKKDKNMPNRIIYLWSLIDINEKKYDPELLGKSLDLNFFSLVYLVQSIGKDISTDIKIEVVTSNIFEVNGVEELSPEKAVVLGPCIGIPQEYPNIRCRCIDIGLPGSKKIEQTSVVNRLFMEINSNFSDPVVAHRNDHRWLRVFDPLPLEESLEKHGKLRLKHGGVYFITGGMGLVGHIIAKYLAKEMHAKLILTGISQLPPRNEWQQWLIEKGEDDPLSRKINKVLTLEKLGGEVLVFSADAANEKQMQEVVDQAESKFGPINGVIHAAGTVRGEGLSAIEMFERSKCDVHFGPKIYGLVVLEKVLAERELDFLFMTSSMSCILGGLGHLAYSTANIFMDAYTHYHNHKNLSRWTAINWEIWSPNKKQSRQGNLGKSLLDLAIEPEEGIKILLRVLSCNNPQIINSTGDLELRINQWVKLESVQGKDNIDKEFSVTIQPRPDLSTPYVAPRNDLEQIICDIWKDLFGIELIGVEDDFFEIGGDSLKAIRLLSYIQKDFEASLTEMFRYRTISTLAANLPYKKNLLKLKIEEAKKRAARNNLEEELKRREIALAPQMREYMEKIEPYRNMDLSERIIYRSIFLTGVTGYLGSYLLENLLKRTDSNFYLLVRGESPEKAKQRVISTLKFYFDEALYEMYQSRIHIVHGDLGRERFGLSEDDYNQLSEEIDCIINSAAYVKYYGHDSDYVYTNEQGVRQLIKFALAGNKKDLNHISTMGVVFGTYEDYETQGYKLCTEFDQELTQDMVGTTPYVQSKNKSEKLIIDARSQGLNATVFRVGTIVFDSNTGKFQKNIEEHAFYNRIRSLVKLGVMYGSDLPALNFTFVDRASETISLLFDRKALLGETYHIFNSKRISTNELSRMISEAGIPLKSVSHLELIELLEKNYDHPDLKEYAEKLITLTPIIFDGAVGTPLQQTFEKTEVILNKLGFYWEKPNKDQIKKMMEYNQQVGFF
jgi:thioester reductase-like protein